MPEFKYVASFDLDNIIPDLDGAFEEATAFLRENSEGIAQYVYGNADDGQPLNEIVTKAEWSLASDERGNITIQTTRELTTNEIKEVSEWLAGQCSDGIGESFEQQDFACYYCDEMTGDVYDDYDLEMLDDDSSVLSVMCSMIYRDDLQAA